MEIVACAGYASQHKHQSPYLHGAQALVSRDKPSTMSVSNKYIVKSHVQRLGKCLSVGSEASPAWWSLSKGLIKGGQEAQISAKSFPDGVINEAGHSFPY